MKRFIVLGSTGSIGTSSLDVISSNPGDFKAVALTANNSVDLIIQQIEKHRPRAIAMADKSAADRVRSLTSGNVEVFSGDEGILELIRSVEADAVINGLVGSAGLEPTLTALEHGVDVLLANKETIVMGGAIVMETVKRTGRRIVPIDSEMSAIYQCLNGDDPATVRRLIITASGGPFIDMPLEKLKSVTLKAALRHPTWAMGKKNTIDSASLMNKGLEVIEASHLFGIPGERINVTVHRSSISHSFVEFIDGSLLCQLSMPDMRLAIQYAMTAPRRLQSPYGSIDFTKPLSLTFEPPDLGRFPCLNLAYEVLARGGTAPAAMNGANERAVKAFIDGACGFMDIPRLIRTVMEGHRFIETPTVEDLIATDREAKRRIEQLI